jgi:hypothetical protein
MEEKIRERIEGIVLVLRNLFYILSVIYPLFGIIAGIVLQNKRFSPEIKGIGQVCFWIGIVVILIVAAICLIALRPFFW